MTRILALALAFPELLAWMKSEKQLHRKYVFKVRPQTRQAAAAGLARPREKGGEGAPRAEGRARPWRCRRHTRGQLLALAKAILKPLPSLVDLPLDGDAHINVCGDTHGQFYDLINIFDVAGEPSPTNPYVSHRANEGMGEGAGRSGNRCGPLSAINGPLSSTRRLRSCAAALQWRLC